MSILITGSGGLVGSQLTPLFRNNGQNVLRLVRRAATAPDERSWDPATGRLDASVFEGVEAVVHLGGDNIGEGRWNQAKKERIRTSRVDSTRLLTTTMAGLKQPPAVFVSASAIGFYGDRGDELLTEDSPPGQGFLAEVCQQWEQAANPVRDKGIRCVHLRLGVVLSQRGGALSKMLLPFRLGLGGIIGSGKQYWSWLTDDEAAGIFFHAVNDQRFSGPMNAVTPRPVTNLEFTKALGLALRRPTLFPMPACVARLALGEMADALILSSARVEPQRLRQIDYQFRHPDLAAALIHVLAPRTS